MNNSTLLLALCLIVGSASEFSRSELCKWMNEHFVDCFNPCNTCAHRDVQCSIVCAPGCDCLPGHLRNDSGVCIPQELCRASDTLSEITEDIQPNCARIICRANCKQQNKVGECVKDRCKCS
ncbi:hypothetical protein NPIL_74611 [Nephila pilipes]|uniref:TIL domain-containing protein n=1 Tax=Nephila pilipes TaxID=299642 RepID=A0A8X6NNV4_NEPPI|nr:hypothetical protein NPIL_74611 [Nephila pilipes]